jgi:hypothetical protein
VAGVSLDFTNSAGYGGGARRSLSEYDSLLASRDLKRVITLRGSADWLVTYVRTSFARRAMLSEVELDVR